MKRFSKRSLLFSASQNFDSQSKTSEPSRPISLTRFAIFPVMFALAFSILPVLLQSTTFAAGNGQDDRETTAVESEHPQRSIGDIRRDLEAFVKNTRQDEDYNLQVGAAVDLCHLHHEIVTDPRYKSNSRLQNFRAFAAERLKRYAKEVELEMKRRDRAQKKSEAAARRGRGSDSESANGSGDDGDDENESWNDETTGEERSSQEPPTAQDRALADSMNDSMYSMSSMTGGPVQVFGYLGGNFAPPWDHGFELLELIESTINPEFWRTNGGEGRIEYYRPSRVLVVTASQEMHDRLEDFLNILKYSSR